MSATEIWQIMLAFLRYKFGNGGRSTYRQNQTAELNRIRRQVAQAKAVVDWLEVENRQMDNVFTKAILASETEKWGLLTMNLEAEQKYILKERECEKLKQAQAYKDGMILMQVLLLIVALSVWLLFPQESY